MKKMVCGLCVLWVFGCGTEDSFDFDDLEVSATQCQDEFDNDDDGAVDCEDADCAGFVFCATNDTDKYPTYDTDFEDCLEGSYSVTNTIDYNHFVPYKCITGNLTISMPSEKISLPNLKRVGGDLKVHYSTKHTELGLDSLTDVGGSLSVFCPHEKPCTSNELSHFINIETIGSGLELSSFSDDVKDLEVFRHFIPQEGFLILRSMKGLENLDAFEGMRTIQELNLDSNINLTDISGLENVTTVDRAYFSFNSSLPTCDICKWLSGVTVEFSGLDVYDNKEEYGCTSCPCETCPE